MKKFNFIFRLLIIAHISLINFSNNANAQYCDSITPTMNVDLSAAPNLGWISPDVQRDGNCCGTSNPDKCLEFVITLHPDAIAVSFNIASGAIPPGALFYQIDCGIPTPVGSPICLSGAGPHTLTFCKPGNNSNTFSITSYSSPIIGPDISLNDGCQGMIYANYYNETSISWTSIAPGVQGAYDSFLSCTSGCDTTFVSGNNPPAYVDYLVCGNDIGGCNPNPICDTIRVNFIPPVQVSVSPSVAHLCFGDPGITVTATAASGTGPYSYNWNNGSTSSSIFVGAGTHIVQVQDASGCLIVTDTAVITQDALPIIANAGNDFSVCSQSLGFVSLSGTIQMATGGIWSGGSGVFSPSNTSLLANYSPSAAEIANGYVDLSLATTGNNGCPGDTDVIRVSFLSYNETTNLTTSNISCFGNSDGQAQVITSGTYSPCTYSWDGGAITSTNTTTGLAPGNHQVLIVNSMGCDTLINFVITEPTILVGNLDAVNNVTCNTGNNGSSTVSAIGGTPPYNYTWNTLPVQNSSTATGLIAGNYSCTITDANNCAVIVNVIITEPQPLTLVLGGVSPNCYGNSNGAISSTVNGGTVPYNYLWSNSETSSNLYNLTSGNYILNVTDANNCMISENLILIDPQELTATITGDTVICPNSNIDLQVLANGGTGTYSYNWTPAASNSPINNVAPIGVQAYTCVVSDNNGCQTTVNTTVDVNRLDADDLIATINDNEICAGDDVWLNANYNGPDNTVTMEWLHCPSCPTNAAISETPTNSMQYVLSATNYCLEQIFDTVEVLVNPNPIVDLSPLSGEVCPNEDITFTNLGENNVSWTYLWTYGDGNGSSEMSPTYSYSDNGIYNISLTVINENGCSTTLENGSEVIVHSSAIADFGISSYEISMLDPVFEFYNGSANANEFHWYFGDNTNSNEINPVHEYSEAGDYVVTLYANNINGCYDSTNAYITVTPAFELYVPNAFTPDGDRNNGIFLPQGFGISDQDYEFLIFNRWGDNIFSTEELGQGWDGTINSGQFKSQDGVFTWVITFRDVTGAKHQRKGHVSILK